MDEAHILGVGGKNREHIFSLWGKRGDRFYCSRGHKSVNSYTTGEGRTIRVWFFHSCIPRLSLVICSFILGSSHSSLFLFLGPILWPFLIPCSYLTVYLFPFSGIWEPGLRGKGRWLLWLLQAAGASWGSRVPLPALCQDAFTEGDESPWNDKATCFSIVWMLASKYCCQTITWRFVVF